MKAPPAYDRTCRNTGLLSGPPLVFWGIKRINFCNRAKQEAALKAPPAYDHTCRNTGLLPGPPLDFWGIVAMWGFFWGQVAPSRAASCLLVNKKNYLLPPPKAGGGLEGAACLQPHLPQYRAPFKLSPLVFWGIVAMWGFFWGQVAPFRAASCLLGNKKKLPYATAQSRRRP